MSQPAFTIRPANLESDPEQVAGLINQVDPKPVTGAEARAWFTYLPDGRISRRTVADAGGQAAGYSAVVHEAYFPPGEFYVWVAVDPSRRGQGIGSALYGDALAFMNTQGAVCLRSEVREDCPAGRQFASRRGFTEDRQLFESVLELSQFDESPHLPLLERLEAEDVRFFSMADVPDEEESLRRLYEVNRATAFDIPGQKEFPDFAEFQAMVRRGDWYLPQGQLVAAVGETWVGLAAVQWMPEAGEVYHLMTGVLREYRGRGIARALKIQAIRYARSLGARLVRTNNDSANLAIIAVNRRLGYRPEPGKSLLVADLK